MRLGFWQKSCVFVSTAAVATTGFAWFALHDYVLEEPDDLTHLLLVAHGVAAYLLLLVIGSLLPLHVKSGWRRRRNLVTGISVTFAAALLAATALILYYGGEDTRLPARWIHIVVGTAATLLFSIHALAGRSRDSL